MEMSAATLRRFHVPARATRDDLRERAASTSRAKTSRTFANVRAKSKVPFSFRVRRERGDSVVTRAEPSSINDIVLQGGPLLLPLVLSTSAALYRGAMKAKKSSESTGFEALGRAFGFLPPGIWAGIGLVWAYWTASQAGVF
jgi:hypothetical protein